mgnify:CR=1 FL=1
MALLALSGKLLGLINRKILKDILMYQDLIRNELNEAAETLANFLKDDAKHDPMVNESYCETFGWVSKANLAQHRFGK